MTVNEVIATVDSRMIGNRYPIEEKVRWLSDLDSRIYAEVISRYEDSGAKGFSGYSADGNLNDEMIATDGYAEMYVFYLQAMINKENCEYTRYNNGMLMFNTFYSLFTRQYNRKHRAKRAVIYF